MTCIVFYISVGILLLLVTVVNCSDVQITKDITIHFKEGDACGFNRKYTYCGNTCNTSCETFGSPCTIECAVGCLCADGYAEFEYFGVCVPIYSPLCKWDRLWRNETKHVH